jgi:hypothetical protein
MLEKNIQPAFKEAEQSWYLGRLYKDLANIKGKNLSPMEKSYLRGLLLGQSPAKIAETFSRGVKGLEVDLSKTLYQYIKILLDHSDEKIENWREIRNWLEEAGYKKPTLELNPLQITGTIGNIGIDIGTIINISQVTIEKFHVERIKTENSKIAIEINIRLISNTESTK